MNTFAAGFAAWLAGAAIWFWWVRRYDRFEPEPVRQLLVVGVLGGLVSGIVAGIGNELVAVALGIDGGVGGIAEGGALTASVALALATFVGFNEEILKALAAVLLTSRFGDLDEPVDAPLYAMITALGFAAFENVQYAAQHGGACCCRDTCSPRLCTSCSRSCGGRRGRRGDSCCHGDHCGS